eukprot:94232-Prorocentrum_minimum.AAC.4
MQWIRCATFDSTLLKSAAQRAQWILLNTVTPVIGHPDTQQYYTGSDLSTIGRWLLLNAATFHEITPFTIAIRVGSDLSQSDGGAPVRSLVFFPSDCRKAHDLPDRRTSLIMAIIYRCCS